MSEHYTAANALQQMSKLGGQRWVTMFKHGHIELEYYKPLDQDPQKPHTRDECYFVLSGSGVFVQENERVRFGAGDVFFVPAGVPHRFENFTDDFATWAIFAG
jgi:mannose-6-phosphate isomerase-like protein (cupin superfamily)